MPLNQHPFSEIVIVLNLNSDNKFILCMTNVAIQRTEHLQFLILELQCEPFSSIDFDLMPKLQWSSEINLKSKPHMFPLESTPVIIFIL